MLGIEPQTQGIPEYAQLVPAHRWNRIGNIGIADLLKWIVFSAVGLILSIPVIIAVRCGLYDSFIDNPLTSWGMWGTFVIHLVATKPNRKEIAATSLLGLMLRLMYDVLIGEKGYTGSVVVGMGVFLGLASLIVLVVQFFRSTGERRAAIKRNVVMIGMLNYMSVGVSYYVSFAAAILPSKLDCFLYLFDLSLGAAPSYVVGKFVKASPSLYWFIATIYDSLGFWFCVLYAAHAREHGKFRLNIVSLFLWNVFIGFSLYFVFPALGPKYAFPVFPNPPIHVQAKSILLHGLPNAMPSLHFATAVLIVLMSRPWKWMRAIAGSICLFTAVATLSIGEHYFVDLVVALPYALVIFALASDVRDKRFPVLISASVVLTWFAVLRYGYVHPALSWALVIVTIILFFKLERRLAHNVWAPSR